MNRLEYLRNRVESEYMGLRYTLSDLLAVSQGVTERVSQALASLERGESPMSTPLPGDGDLPGIVASVTRRSARLDLALALYHAELTSEGGK